MLRHFFTNSFGILTSRVLGFVRDLLTAATLGASVWSDVFFVAFKLPNLFRRLFGEGAFTQAFLPNFVKSKKKGLFFAEILFKFAAFMLALSGLVMIFAPFVARLLAAGFDEATLALAVPLVRINFWYLFLIFIVTLFAAVLQYKNHFATTAFSTALLNISMICALGIANLVGASESAATYFLSYGVVIGGALQVGVHILAFYKLGLAPLFKFGSAKFLRGSRSDTKGFWANFFQGVVGSSATQLGDFLTTIIASFLSVGAISYLYYANRIFQLPLALFAIALSTAIFPKISKQIKAGDEIKARQMLEKSFHLLFFLLLFSTLGAVFLAREIIWLLFERGAFSRENTEMAANVLQMAMIGLLPFGLYKLFSLWLYANFKQKIAAKISIYSLFVNLALCLALFRFGAPGLALAGSLQGAFLFGCVIFIFGFKEFLAIIANKKTLLTLAGAAVFGCVLYYLEKYLYAYL